MKTVFAACVSVIVMICTPAAWAQAPKSLGGFVLDQQIGSFNEHLLLETVMPIRYQPYLAEVQIKETADFKSGLITYGQCDQTGRIVRIKLKYQDDGKKFFETLLKRYKQRFGKPDEYKGDPFHILTAWKWSFKDDQGNRVSLTLQHNSRDFEQKQGTAVKLTLTDAIERERACYQKRFPDKPSSTQDDPEANASKRQPDWEQLVPH